MIEFGRAFNYWISMNHLASEGARWAAVDKVPASNPPNPQATSFPKQLNTYISEQILTAELQKAVGYDGATRLSSGVTLCYVPTTSGAPPTAGDAVRVKIVAKDYKIGLVFMPAITLDMTGSSTMRLEQTPASSAGWSTCA